MFVYILWCFWAGALYTLDIVAAALWINVSWFGAAVYFFGIAPGTAIDWFLPRKYAENKATAKLYQTVKCATIFLGGINSSLLLLSSMMLLHHGQLFVQATEQRILFLVMASAHGSLFVINVPSALQRSGIFPNSLMVRLLHPLGFTPADVEWNKPDDMMHAIFLGDAMTFALNTYVALARAGV